MNIYVGLDRIKKIKNWSRPVRWSREGGCDRANSRSRSYLIGNTGVQIESPTPSGNQLLNEPVGR